MVPTACSQSGLRFPCALFCTQSLFLTCYISMCRGAPGTAPVVPLSRAGAALLPLCKHHRSLPGSTSPARSPGAGKRPRRRHPVPPGSPVPFPAGCFASPVARREWALTAAFPPTAAFPAASLGPSVPTSTSSSGFVTRGVISTYGISTLVCFSLGQKLLNTTKCNPSSASSDAGLPPHCRCIQLSKAFSA